ncbi:MAG: class I SAM-dependent methyltransferase [Chloroflexota bacterium]
MALRSTDYLWNYAAVVLKTGLSRSPIGEAKEQFLNGAEYRLYIWVRMNPNLIQKFQSLFVDKKSSNLRQISERFVEDEAYVVAEDQEQTKTAFSNKWKQVDHGSDDYIRALERQKAWYLELYGFDNETQLASFLNQCEYVLDAGAGKCGKAAWFAELSPSTLVVAADISTSLYDAAEYYSDVSNLFFVRCDIGSMPFFSDSVYDYISCDQVIHHTAQPRMTFAELVRLAGENGDIACYVYRKKALPRELLDDHFRTYSKELSHEDLIALSSQLTNLGRILSSVEDEIDFPDIPLMGIEGGKMTIQRFLYWNFIKCFWNEQMGEQLSTITNYDWYSPSQAYRYTEEEFRSWSTEEKLETVHFHSEQACYSGRFRKNKDKPE